MVAAVRLLLAALLISGGLRAVINDGLAQQAQANQAYNNDITQRNNFKAAMALACPDNGVTMRVATYGHSVARLYGQRLYAMQNWYDRGNRVVQWVGSQNVNESEMGCPGTDAIDGADTPTVLAQMVTLPTIMPSPTANDMVLLWMCSNDAHNGIPLTVTAANQRQAMQNVVAAGPAMIGVLTEIPRSDEPDNPVTMAEQNAMLADNVAWARAQGWPNVIRFADVHDSVTPGPSDDIPDGGHPSLQGCYKIQASAAPQLFP